MLRTVTIHYFKWTGKFYTETEVEIEDNTEPYTKNGTPSVANMAVISRQLGEWQREGKLPGLSPGKWGGLIWYDCADGSGYPCIKVPEAAVLAMEVEIEKADNQ